MAYKSIKKQKAYEKKWHQLHKEERVKRAAISNVKARARNKEYVKNYLLSHPCVDCKETDPIVLEFDHVRGKKRTEVTVLG